MRRVRISTWILTAVFLAALVTYLNFRPVSDTTDRTPPTTSPSSVLTPSPSATGSTSA